MKEAEVRPAQALRDANPGHVFYLDDYMRDARSYGQLYFRGDTHTNWMGAWLAYRFVHRKLEHQRLLARSPAYALSDMVPAVASYDGDLWSQINGETKDEYRRWNFLAATSGFELAIQLVLPQNKCKAGIVEVPADYQRWFSGRESFVYEREDGQGPRAVIFRDSTLDFCHNLLAQHFSRSVFIWHQGQVYDEVIQREKPDIVLHIMAERFVTSYPKSPVFAPLRA